MIRVLIAALLALAACDAHAETKHAVYGVYGIASVQAGWNQSRNLPVGYKVSFVGIGPVDASSKLDECIHRETLKAGKATWVPFDDQILDAPALAKRLAAKGELSAKTLASAQKTETDKMARTIARIERDFRASVATCAFVEDDVLADVHLGIVNRYCVAWAPSPCEPRTPIGRQRDRRTTRYAKVSDWLVAYGAAKPVDEIVVLVASGSGGARINPDLRDREYIIAPNKEEAQRQFETGSEVFRRKGLQYDYAAARAISLDRSVAMHLVDVIDHPAFALPSLPNNYRVLGVTSDEVARARLKECALFRAQSSPSEASACAGYVVTAAQLGDCLGGGTCRPEFADKAWAAAMIIGGQQAGLTTGSPFPRIAIPGTFGDYAEVARDCARQSPNAAETNYCVLHASMSGKDRQVLECIRGQAFRDGGTCVAAVLPDTPETKVARCLLEQKSDRAKVLCAAASNSPEAAQAIRCYERAGGSGMQAAACLAADKLPPQLRSAAQCATTYPGDYTRIGGCVAAEELGGDAGKLAGCAMSSGGSYAAAAVCLAGGGLTPEQQILLQCATTSVDPTSFAVCTGGQLAMREYQKCKDVGYDEGDCFGPSNEFRVFSRRLGLGDIGKETVVGQIASVEVEVAKFHIATAEKALADAGKILEGAGQAAVEMMEAIVGALADIQGDGERVATKTMCDFVGICIDDDGPSFRIPSPSLLPQLPGGLSGAALGADLRKADPFRDFIAESKTERPQLKLKRRPYVVGPQDGQSIGGFSTSANRSTTTPPSRGPMSVPTDADATKVIDPSGRTLDISTVENRNFARSRFAQQVVLPAAN